MSHCDDPYLLKYCTKTYFYKNNRSEEIPVSTHTVKPPIERHGALFFNPSSLVAVNWKWRSNRGWRCIFEMAHQNFAKINLALLRRSGCRLYFVLFFQWSDITPFGCNKSANLPPTYQRSLNK